jgi:hypothetical protein
VERVSEKTPFRQFGEQLDAVVRLPETSRGDGGSLFEAALKDLPSLGLLVKLMLDNVKGVLRF